MNSFIAVCETDVTVSPATSNQTQCIQVHLDLHSHILCLIQVPCAKNANCSTAKSRHPQWFKRNLEKNRKNRKLCPGIENPHYYYYYKPTPAESLLSYKSLPIFAFLNPIVYCSLLDPRSPVRMLLCFRTMLMIFLDSLNSEVQGEKTWLHCQVYCSVEGSEAQSGYSRFMSFPSSFGPFLPKHASRIMQLLELPSQREGSLHFHSAHSC